MKWLLKLGVLLSLATSVSAQTSSSVTIANAGLFTNTQMNLYVQSILNSCNPQTEYQALQGIHYTTEAFTGCIVIPSSSTVTQPNAIAGYINNASTASNGVAVYGQSRATAVNAHVWGANFVASDGISAGSNFSDNEVFGTEIDMGNWNAGSSGAGISFGGTLQSNNNFVAIQIPTVVQPWGAGISFISVGGLTACKFCIDFQTGASSGPLGSAAAIIFNPVASGTNQASQGLAFVANDPSSGQNVVSLNESAAGNLQVSASKAGAGLTVNGGTVYITGNGDGTHPIANETKRVSGCATGAAQFNTCDVTVTWTTPFADANYTAQCTGDAVTSGVPVIEGIDISAVKTAMAITVRTVALTAAAARFTTIDCVAVHD